MAIGRPSEHTPGGETSQSWKLQSQFVDFDKYVGHWSGKYAIYAFVAGFSIPAFVMVILVIAKPEQFSLDLMAFVLSLLGGGVTYGIGGMWGLRDGKDDYRDMLDNQIMLRDSHVKAEALPITEANRGREIEINTARGTAVIVQPRAGAFSAWLGDVINPDSKVTFSGRQAKTRDWHDWQYINLVAQLKAVGWLHPTRTINGAPDINEDYLEEVRAWHTTPLL